MKTADYAQYFYISRFIKLQRELLNLTQRSLAKSINLSQSSIAQLEAGEKRPSLDTIFKLAMIFKCSPKKFFLN